MVQAKITKSSPWAASMSLVFSDNVVPLGAGVPLERGRQRGIPPKRRYFDPIGSSSVKTVAGRYRHAAYYNNCW